jgi:hypothetical protein
MSKVSSLLGAPPKDANFSNLAVQNTMVVRGRLLAQTLEAVDFIALDLSTLNDAVITGNLEVDGTSLFSGGVTFASTVTLANGTTLDVTTTDITITGTSLTGTATLTQQGSVVFVNAALVNGTGGNVTAGADLFTLPAGSLPAADLFTGSYVTDSQTVAPNNIRLTAATGLVEYEGAGNWASTKEINFSFSYIVA